MGLWQGKERGGWGIEGKEGARFRAERGAVGELWAKRGARFRAQRGAV